MLKKKRETKTNESEQHKRLIFWGLFGTSCFEFWVNELVLFHRWCFFFCMQTERQLAQIVLLGPKDSLKPWRNILAFISSLRLKECLEKVSYLKKKTYSSFTSKLTCFLDAKTSIEYQKEKIAYQQNLINIIKTVTHFSAINSNDYFLIQKNQQNLLHHLQFCWCSIRMNRIQQFIQLFD